MKDLLKIAVIVAAGYFGWQYWQQSRGPCEKLRPQWEKTCKEFAERMNVSSLKGHDRTDGDYRRRCMDVYMPEDPAQCEVHLSREIPTGSELMDDVMVQHQRGNTHTLLD